MLYRTIWTLNLNDTTEIRIVMTPFGWNSNFESLVKLSNIYIGLTSPIFFKMHFLRLYFISNECCIAYYNLLWSEAVKYDWKMRKNARTPTMLLSVIVIPNPSKPLCNIASLVILSLYCWVYIVYELCTSFS